MNAPAGDPDTAPAGAASEAAADPTLVVGVGASAGGLEAFKRLLSALPPDTGLALVLVQHLDPTHESLLTELLVPCTRLSVREALQGERLARNTVHVIRPDCALAVKGGRVELTEPTLHRGVRLPVDHLFRSLAREYGSRSVGIVLSGAGSDGSSGLRDIKSAGGLTIAQEPGSGRQSGMPQAAIDTGILDLVLAIEDMPTALARFAALPPDARLDPATEAESLAGREGEEGDGTGRDEEAGGGEADGAGADGSADGTGAAASSDRTTGPLLERAVLSRLAAVLEAQIGFDLDVYKRSTVERRVLRRMALSGFDDIDAWLDHVRANEEEQRVLVRDLMISVTSFFRDAEAFEALREQAIEPLVANASPGDPVRVWVAGCATGEEAYSIGMELLDAA